MCLNIATVRIKAASIVSAESPYSVNILLAGNNIGFVIEMQGSIRVNFTNLTPLSIRKRLTLDAVSLRSIYTVPFDSDLSSLRRIRSDQFRNSEEIGADTV